MAIIPPPTLQGGLTAVAEVIGGKWLGWWVVLAAAVSQIGQFEAEMSTDSFQLQVGGWASSQVVGW